MNKALLAFAGSALVASSAFAAGFDINVGEDQLADISSGTVSTDDCTQGLLLDVERGAYDTAQDTWSVTGVRVSAATTTALGALCGGFEVTASIDTATAATATTTHTVEAGDTELVLPLLVTDPVTELWVDDVVNVRVLVDEPNLVPPPTLVGENGFNERPSYQGNFIHRRHSVTPEYSDSNGHDLFTVDCGSGQMLTRFVIGQLDLDTSGSLTLRSTMRPTTSTSGVNANEYVILDVNENVLHQFGNESGFGTTFSPSFERGDTIIVGSAWCGRTPVLDSRDYVSFIEA